jgi:hypothetical protein
MSSRTVIDFQRDYEQLLARKRQLEEQQQQALTVFPSLTIPHQQQQHLQQPVLSQRDYKQLSIYNAKRHKQEVYPSLKCRDMIIDWCRMQFSTSRIVASRCYKQAQEFFDSGAKNKNVLLSVRERLQLTKEDYAKFWGIEMEFKVKKIFRECFGLVIEETETFRHSKDNSVVAKPDGLIKFGLKVENLPQNLENSFELEGDDIKKNELVYEGKAPFSGQVGKNIKRDYYLQCCLEMACSGRRVTFFNVWAPGCLCVWLIYWDQEFWNKILRPLYFEAKVNFDGSGKAIETGNRVVRSFDTQLGLLENRTPEEFKSSFDQTINEAIQRNCQKIFLAQKLDQRSDWGFESCPVVPEQPSIDATKVTSIPVTILDHFDRKVYWQTTPNLEAFKKIQQNIFVKA